jgi:chromate transporter
VAAIVLQAVHRIGSRTLKKPATAPWLWAIAIGSFVALYFFKLPFPAIVLTAAVLGWIGSRLAPAQFSGSAEHGGSKAVQGQHLKAVIDDHTPTPKHARFTPRRLTKVLLLGAALWLMPMAALIAWQGWDSTLAQMAWFFTKAALLTFGGAYAVLPYVYQGAVEHFGWLSSAQMIDGLALGETTPGPLIMVVSFVGFLGGWSAQVLGSQSLFAGAALAATVVTWFTFLPSFIFILAGGPLVEATHGKLQFTAPLLGVTAAVVGVIASLALFFMAHIAIKPDAAGSLLSQSDLVPLVLMLCAAVALLRYRVGVIPVILACAVAGAGLGFAH